jgi:hypothetical protein
MTKYSVEGKAAETKAPKERAYRIPRKMKGRQDLQDGEPRGEWQNIYSRHRDYPLSIR